MLPAKEIAFENEYRSSQANQSDRQGCDPSDPEVEMKPDRTPSPLDPAVGASADTSLIDKQDGITADINQVGRSGFIPR